MTCPVAPGPFTSRELQDVQDGLRVLLLLQLGDVGGLEEPRPLLRDALHRCSASGETQDDNDQCSQCSSCHFSPVSRLSGFSCYLLDLYLLHVDYVPGVEACGAAGWLALSAACWATSR
ncbi:hypothetical protein EYF80_057212 [Liparis tanakae]|uniref:Uncharacterized protein n=1 Tax=Liparis tanakae TaxID=230148 RepID=A0A4Z2EUM2_9TELE|nr:hypothetical protein EYF80_057212 [Liparis tanakae]